MRVTPVRVVSLVVLVGAIAAGVVVSKRLRESGAAPGVCGPTAAGWTGRVSGVRIAATRPATEARTIVLINTYRRQHGLRPVTLDARLALAARYHNADMALRGYFEHDRVGETFPQRLARYTPCGRVGETMTFGSGGYATAAGIVSLWRSSPPHRAILLAPWARRVGVGVSSARLFDNAGTVATADFAAGP